MGHFFIIFSQNIYHAYSNGNQCVIVRIGAAFQQLFHFFYDSAQPDYPFQVKYYSVLGKAQYILRLFHILK